MALLQQGSRLKSIGGFTSRTSANFATGVHRANGVGALIQARQRLFSLGDADVFERSDQASIPRGTRPPYCWALAQVGGGFKSYKRGEIALDGTAIGELGLSAEVTGDIQIDGTAIAGIVLSIVGTGSMQLDGTVLLSNILGVTAAGDVQINGAASLELLSNILAAGTLEIDGLVNLMQLQSFSATDAVASGSTQEIIDGVVAGLAGQTGLTPTQEAWLREVWQKEGLDASTPVTITKTKISIGDPLAPLFEILLTGDLKNLTKMERQP
jgi:hypothetical protein